MAGPNPITALISMLRARRLHSPSPTGDDVLDHGPLDRILDSPGTGGVATLQPLEEQIAAYRDTLSRVDPDALTRDGALAYWLNLYNTGALDLARRTSAAGGESVLRVPGGFSEPFVTVAGEPLSLDGIEHGKIRRFQDPRIHGALICGSASCPTLRAEAYRGPDLGAQLDDQMRSFLAAGGAVQDSGTNRLLLSRVFLWYGGDVVRPHRMPTLVPAGKKQLTGALRRWLSPEIVEWLDAEDPRVAFQDYDWSLGCAVG